MNKNVVAIIQARTGSTRLPGKVLMDISGKSMLGHVVERLSYCKFLDKTVIATTDMKSDDGIEKFCDDNGVFCFRGSEKDVLQRYYEAARANSASAIVRITADCPLIDPHVVDKAVMAYLDRFDSYDGASNVIRRTYPRGLDVEVVSFQSLEECHKEAKEAYQREHVTVYLYENPSKFNLYSVEQDDDLSLLRWTVDEDFDFKLISEIYKRLYRKGGMFYMEDVVNLLKKCPELKSINSGIKQKPVS